MRVIQEIFAERLAALMEQRKITKYQLAKDLSFSQTSVANWLNKSAVPSRRSLEALARYFGVTLNDLGAVSGLVASKYDIQYVYPDKEYRVDNDPTALKEEDIEALLEDLRTRSDMRMLFKVAHGATTEDVRQAVKIIEALRKTEDE